MKLKKIDGVYHAQFRTVTGTRRLISTKQTDRAQALAVVKQAGIAELEQAALAGRLSREVVGRILTGKRMTLARAVGPFRDWMKSRGRSPKTIAENTLTLTAWTRERKLAAFAPASITEAHIAGWINDGTKARSQSTRQVALVHLRRFFAFCAANGWVAADPSQAVGIDHSVLSHDQKEPGERLPFSPAELLRLTSYLRTCRQDLDREIQRVELGASYSATGRAVKLAQLGQRRADLAFWLFAVQCSATTGLRLSDIAGLEWRCFSEAGKLIVWMDKTNRRIEHALTPELERLVTQLPVTSSTHLFPSQHATVGDVLRRSLLSVQFKRLCTRLDIRGRSFHSLRHAVASQQYHAIDKDALAKRLAENLSLTQITQLLGHSNPRTAKGYVH